MATVNPYFTQQGTPSWNPTSADNEATSLQKINGLLALISVNTASSGGGSGGPFYPIAGGNTNLITGTVAQGVSLGYTDTGVGLQSVGSLNSYYQAIIQNTSSGATASSDFVVNNNNSTATTFYGDFGMNSSGFSGTGALNAVNNVYLTSTSSDLAIGTTTANAIHFLVNSGATDAMTINSAGAILFPGLNTAGFLTTSDTTGQLQAPSWSVAPASSITIGQAIVLAGGALAKTSGGATAGGFTVNGGACNGINSGQNFGGNVAISGGAASGSTVGNTGGNVSISGGFGSGTGAVNGNVNVGTSGTAVVTIGNVSNTLSGIAIAGRTNATTPSAGFVGETITSLVATGAAVSITTSGTAINVTSISLTAGDWDVSGNINYNLTVATQTAATAGISTATATIPTDGSEVESGSTATALTGKNGITLPTKRINVSATTTVFLVARAVFSAGSESAYGSIVARRRT